MLKLMKYEFRKQAFSKVVILVILALIEIAFFVGVILSKENTIMATMLILVLFTIGSMFFFAFEAIITYSNDLMQKSSYMLFLTPNTSYGIVGAKVLSAGIQIVLAGLAFFAVFAINGAVLIAKYNAIAKAKEFFKEMIRQIFQLDITFSDVASIVMVVITSWIFVVTLAFFSITLSTTFLANKKYKGILSFLIFIIINYVLEYIINYILKGPVDSDKATLYFSIYSLYMLCFTIITYIGTAWMLDKKVSV